MATSLRDGEESQIWTNRFGQLTITQAALAASGRNCKDEPGSQSAPVWSKQVYIVTNQEDTEKELKRFPSKGN